MKNFLIFDLYQQCDFKRGRHHGYLNVFAMLGRMASDEQVAAFVRAAEQRHDDDRGDDTESYLYGVVTGAKSAVKDFDGQDGGKQNLLTTLDFMVPRLRELERESRESIELCEMVDNMVPLPLEVSV
jgi:hypothetical protein